MAEHDRIGSCITYAFAISMESIRDMPAAILAQPAKTTA